MVIIGIDAEWQSLEHENLALSYQWFGIDDDVCWEGIHYPNIEKGQTSKRLKLHQWVSLALQKQYKGRRWPREVIVTSHFSPAEFSLIEDFGDLKRRVDIVQGTSFVTTTNPIRRTCYDKNRNRHDVHTHIADTMLLAPPNGKKLESLGELLGISKIDLPDGYEKDQMLRMLQEQPDAFERYALRDAEITARYIERIQKECRDVGLARRYRPITVGGLAVKIFEQRLGTYNRSYDDIMGVERISVPSGPRRTASSRQYVNELANRHEDLAVRCYHGGRNECFLFGPFNDQVFTDYDLKGAYSTALTAIIEPDFDNLKETTDLNDFHLHEMGFALAKWKFPEDTKFPCLFVKDDNGHGLIYVLEGEGYVTSPEIDLAKRMNAEIEIISGVVVPAKKDGVRPVFDFSRWVNEQRKRFNKSDYPFENAYYKLIGNNIYGKIAQGLKDKSRVFDTRTGSSQQLERSAISDAYAAAYVTGLVRATTSEILSLLPDDVLVGNTITDGVCTTASDEEMAQATSGPQCRFFSSLRKSIDGDSNILEKKGASKGMVFMRTRMHGSLEPLGENPILAKVNMPMGHLKNDAGGTLDNTGKNEALIRQFIDREWDTTWKSRSLKTARKLWDTEGDLLSDEKVQYLGMDYDLKRRPKNPETSQIKNYSKAPHLRFETRPWRNYDDYKKARKFLDRFKEPLKTIGDYEVMMQGVDTYGDKTRRASQRRRLKVFADDIRDRAAVGDDGLHHADGSRLKPREVDTLVKKISKGEFTVTGDQMRQSRKRLTDKTKILSEAYIEVTTSVSSAAQYIHTQYPDYTGKALKSKIKRHC